MCGGFSAMAEVHMRRHGPYACCSRAAAPSARTPSLLHRTPPQSSSLPLHSTPPPPKPLSPLAHAFIHPPAHPHPCLPFRPPAPVAVSQLSSASNASAASPACTAAPRRMWSDMTWGGWVWLSRAKRCGLKIRPAHAREERQGVGRVVQRMAGQCEPCSWGGHGQASGRQAAGDGHASSR